MWRLFMQLLVIIVAFSQPPSVNGARKNWKRPPVRGAFNVDLFVYNKPLVNLASQLQSTRGQVLAMGQLLEQLAQSSRSAKPVQKSHYRYLEAGQTDNYMPRNQGAAMVAERQSSGEEQAESETANATANQIIALPERKQSTDYLGATIRTTRIAAATSEPEIDAAVALSPINKQLVAQQLGENLASLYSHEYQVQRKGNKKIVLINTLGNVTASRIKTDQSREPDSAEVTANPTQSMELQLPLRALPEGGSEGKERQELVPQVATTATANMMELINWSTRQPNFAPPASVLSHVLPSEPLTQVEAHQASQEASRPELSDVANVRQNKVNDANSMTTIEMKSPQPVRAEANSYEKEEKQKEYQQQQESEQTNVNAVHDRQQQQQQQQQQMEPDQGHKHVGYTTKSGSRADNDGHVVPLPESKPEREPAAAAAAVGKPVRLASKTKSRRQQTQQIRAKKPNEIDTKPTMATTSAGRVQSLSAAAEAANSTALLMVGITNVKTPMKASPEITPQDTGSPQQNGKGKGNSNSNSKGKAKGKLKRKGTASVSASASGWGSLKRPSAGSEQEIETTTNWWHILPYAEIRKFLNTIYDSIASDDDVRAERM